MFGLTPYGRKNSCIAKGSDILDLRNVFDNFFNDSIFPSLITQGAGMRADIRETEKEYIVDAEIPGANKENIKLELKDDVLTIAVEHDEQIKEEKENFIRRERRFGSYSRSFHVENVKNEAVTAKYENGILSIVLPKEEETKPNKKKIEIQ